jgi:hypothetical protein
MVRFHVPAMLGEQRSISAKLQMALVSGSVNVGNKIHGHESISGRWNPFEVKDL